MSSSTTPISPLSGLIKELGVQQTYAGLTGHNPSSQQSDEQIEEELRQMEDKYMNKIKQLNSLILLGRTEPRDNQAYAVIAYFLFPQVDKMGNHGMWLILGCFANREDARKYNLELIKKTGIRCSVITKTCQWNTIGPIEQADIKPIPHDLNDKLIEEHMREITAEEEKIEKERMTRRSISVQTVEEQVEGTPAWYAKEKCQLIGLIAKKEQLEKQLNEMNQQIDQTRGLIEQKQSRFPQLDSEWWPWLKQTLDSRGENSAVESLEKYLEKL